MGEYQHKDTDELNVGNGKPDQGNRQSGRHPQGSEPSGQQANRQSGRHPQGSGESEQQGNRHSGRHPQGSD